ncbi:MAG: RusA family crossover junction endodeoxyribonuclease [Eubacterium sp.]
MTLKFVIPVAPRTKKNSQRIVTIGGHPRVIPSRAYKDYEEAVGYYLPRLKDPISAPVNVKAVFFMPTRRRVDLVNLEEALLDVLVRYGVLEDDNSKVVAAMDGSRVAYDKEHPRTEVMISVIKEEKNGKADK